MAPAVPCFTLGACSSYVGLSKQLRATLLSADTEEILYYDAIAYLTDHYPLSMTGEGRRGACKFLLDKCVDQHDDVGKFCFGSLPSEGLKRGNAQTVLLKQYYQYDHGPEDHRVLADLPPAKKQRVSKKQRGLGHKVRRRLQTFVTATCASPARSVLL